MLGKTERERVSGSWRKRRVMECLLSDLFREVEGSSQQWSASYVPLYWERRYYTCHMTTLSKEALPTAANNAQGEVGCRLNFEQQIYL